MKTFILPAVAVAIAGLTSFNAFFQWQSQWQGNRQTQYALEHILSKWKIEIVKAKFHRDREKAVEIAIEATSELLDQAREITSATTGDFFKSIQLPTAK
jgi:DNA-binding transcriptional regulator GbsR (MarR family)